MNEALIPIISLGLSILYTIYKSYKLKDPATFIFNSIMKLIPGRYERLVHQAKVASLAMKFVRYLSKDLSDGKFDDYDIFDLFLTLIEKNKNQIKSYLVNFKP